MEYCNFGKILVDTPVASSQWAMIFDGWVDDVSVFNNEEHADQEAESGEHEEDEDEKSEEDEDHDEGLGDEEGSHEEDEDGEEGEDEEDDADSVEEDEVDYEEGREKETSNSPGKSLSLINHYLLRYLLFNLKMDLKIR